VDTVFARARMLRHGHQYESGIARVRVCHDGYALSVGEVALVLDRRGAQDIVAALTYALLATVPGEEPTDGAAPRKRRRRREPRPRSG
jgi:hypothetical protein